MYIIAITLVSLFLYFDASPFLLLKPACTLLKYKAEQDFSFEMAPQIFQPYQCKGSPELSLYYLAPSSYSWLIFKTMHLLALLILGHTLSCSHDFPYALSPAWNIFPPPVFLINVYSTIKSLQYHLPLKESWGSQSDLLPFATLARTEIITLPIC